MYLCYLVAVDAIVLNVLNFVILMKKKKVWQDIWNSVALFVYKPHIFHLEAD